MKRRKAYAYILTSILALNTCMTVGAVNVEDVAGISEIQDDESEMNKNPIGSVSQNVLQIEENIEVNTFADNRTKQDPFQINSKEDLIELSNITQTITGYYVL